MNAHAKIKLVDNPQRSELARVQDVKLCARALYERAVAYQAIPLYPECGGTRESHRKLYEEALAHLRSAIDG